VASEPPQNRLAALGGFIRSQREMAELSLRELAARTNVSNPYLSQIERGLHEPSMRVLRSIAGALNLSAETLLAQAGWIEPDQHPRADSDAASTEAVIRADPMLRSSQKSALLALYRSYLAANEADAEATA
jgi:transcriptional regulator with XRE-family HTH domain